MRQGAQFLVSLLLALSLGACATAPVGSVSKKEFGAIERDLLEHITTLAGDDYGGRRPGSEGETLTLGYMQRQLEASGYVSGTNDPANPWRAPVELVSSIPIEGRLEFTLGKRTFLMPEGESAVYTSRRRSLVEDSALLFVGRRVGGIPETSVRGKIAVLLSEPGKSPARRDALFEMGAAAVITVVEEKSSIDQLRSAQRTERFSLASDTRDTLSAFTTTLAMETAFGADRWAELVAAAEDKDFVPVEMKGQATIEASTQRREVRSHNLIGRLPGSTSQDGAVLLLAHWDHFGTCGDEGDSDRLCNGAADNASGVAVMLELARRLAEAGPHDRDIYVLATTAEEWGLLGAKAFADSPALPLDSIVAAFNFDTVAIAPRGKNVGFVGEGRTALDDIVIDTVRQSRRKIGSRILAEQFLQRQDGWVLLQRDVPAVVISSAFGDEDTLNRFLASRYHRAIDEVDGIELGGAVEDLLLHEELVKRIADTSQYP